jgi:hypothetical protein
VDPANTGSVDYGQFLEISESTILLSAKYEEIYDSNLNINSGR